MRLRFTRPGSPSAIPIYGTQGFKPDHLDF